MAEETRRSTATVQTAYYRLARSLPAGGGVQLRPCKKSAGRRSAKSAAATTAGTRRGGTRKNAAAATGTAAGVSDTDCS